MISERAMRTSLYKQMIELNISYAWESEDFVVFEKTDKSEPIISEYFIFEKFSDKSIWVTDSNGKTLEKTNRILNLFKLGI